MDDKTTSSTRGEEKMDNFYLEKTFPDSKTVFSFKSIPVSKLIKDCLIVLDTNVLLTPFDTSGKNLGEINKIFSTLKKSNRLFLPERVAREFANNRGQKLAEVFLLMRQYKEKLNSGDFKIPVIPILEEVKEYQDLKQDYEVVKGKINEARRNFNKLESKITQWSWDDSVSKMYRYLFDESNIINPEIDETELKKDLSFRFAHKVSPGYKDASKPDEGIGDLIIWHTILHLGRKYKKNLILVTNEKKSDWFYRNDRIVVSPKFELIDEYHRESAGQIFNIVSFPLFLELLKASKETIEEVRQSTELTTSAGPEIDDIIFKEGDYVYHRKHGIGIIESTKAGAFSPSAVIRFSIGFRRIILDYKYLRKARPKFPDEIPSIENKDEFEID